MMSSEEPFVTPLCDQEPNVSHTSILHIQRWKSICPSLCVGFSTRNGGRSGPPYQQLNISLRIGDDEEHVLHNRKKLCDDIGFDFAAWTCAEQVHGTHVTHIASHDRGAGQLNTHTEIQQSDALVTNQSDILLVSFYADCVPLYFWDHVHQVIGLAHAGWKGTYGKIAAQVLREMKLVYGTSPADVYCAIGPSIGSCCYEVSEDIIDQFALRFGHIENFVSREHEKPRLNLKQLNKDILLESGVIDHHILASGYCTHCRDDLFFSHRRDHGSTGRMVSWIGLKNK